MKNLNKTLIAATVGAMAMGSQVANAAWTAPVPGGMIPVVAEGLAAGKTTVAATANAVYTLTAGQSLTINDTATIDLAGGCTFSSTGPTLLATGDLGAGAATAAPPLFGGTAGSTSATWRALDALSAAPTTLTLNGSAAIFNVSGMASTGGCDLQLSLETSTGLPIGPQNQSLNTALETTTGAADAFQFNGVSLTTNTPLPNTTPTATAQVSTGYTLFAAGATTTGPSSFLLTFNNLASLPTPAPIAIGGLVYELSGDFTGITSVASAAVTGSDAMGDQTGGTAGAFTVDPAMGMAWASNTAAIAPGAAGVPLAVTMTIDGTTAQTARTFNVEARINADATYAANTPIAATLHNTILRNGTFFQTNSTGPLNNIKISDTSGGASISGGEIAVVAYDASGAVVPMAAGCNALPAAVASNATVIIPGADLACMFPGGVDLRFTVNTVSAVVSNVKKSDTGTNLTVYTNSAGGAL